MNERVTNETPTEIAGDAGVLAEVGELRRRLAALEERLAGNPPEQPPGRPVKRQPSRKAVAWVTTGAVLAVLAGASVVYGQVAVQSAVDALWITKEGRVGIGTATPAVLLDVGAGLLHVAANVGTTPTVASQGAYLGWNALTGGTGETDFINNQGGGSGGFAFMNTPPSGEPRTTLMVISGGGNVGIGTATPQADNKLEVNGKIAANSLNVDGNVGIGTTAPIAKLDVQGNVQLGRGIAESWFPYTDGNAYISGKQTIIRSDVSGSHKEFFRINDKGNVGIGTATPSADNKLEVNGKIAANSLNVDGRIKATVINGEKPPYAFEIGNKADTTNWHAVQVPSDIIKSYLGDADGGTIKLLFRVNDRDEVRVITETVYIEQPDKSNNKSPGLYGWTRQLGGGDSSFILGTDAKYEIIPKPWDWMWVRNYPTLPSGQSGADTRHAPGNAWTGTDQYKLEFLTPPNVSATVVIYDR